MPPEGFVQFPQNTVNKPAPHLGFWKEQIVTTLRQHSMTANDLVSHLLSDYHGNIDLEVGLIEMALDQLVERQIVKARAVKRNEKQVVETYLFVPLR